MPLHRNDLKDDPYELFKKWYKIASNHTDVEQPNAMCISTIDEQGFPTSRWVLLKEVKSGGLVFYTNLESAKGKHLDQNPNIAVNFYWQPLSRQIRIQGQVNQIDDQQADQYFATRSRESQISAWASKQSDKLESRDKLLERVEEFKQKFENKEIPRPPFWSGYQINPFKYEFWQTGKDRLHDRFEYYQSDNGWKIRRLYP